MDDGAFRLGHRWELRGSQDVAFHYVSHIATWPDWWPQILSVDTQEPDREVVQVGDSAVMVARSFLPYRLHWHTTVRKIEPPRLIEVDGAVRLGGRLGLTGVVAFELEQDGDRVVVLNRQLMKPDRPLPAWAWPLANWVFNFNHNHAMRAGLPGLQRLLTQTSARATPSMSDRAD